MPHNVRDYGAAGDGETLNTAALQRALDACGNAGGGTVVFPPGRYLSGSLNLRSHTTLHLEAGATLLQSTDMAHYAVPATNDYVYSTASRFVFLHGCRLEGIAITGEGCIDGQRALDARHGYIRGPLTLLIENSKGIVMRDVTVRNSPGWSVTFWGCRDVELTRVKNLDGYADGINPSCCQNVHYRDCLIEGSGDDPLSIKNEPAAAERYGGTYENRPDCGFLTENILVENTTIRDTTHACLKLGTATFGVMRNITFRNCTFENTGAVLCLQLMQPGFPQNPLRRIENLTFENIVARNPRQFIDITSIDAVGPVIQNITFRDCEVTGVREPSIIWGLPDAPVSGLLFDGVQVSGRSSPQAFHARWVEGLALRNSTYDVAEAGCTFRLEDSRAIELANLTLAGHDNADPLIALRDVDGFSMRGCRVPASRTFLAARGAGTRNLVLEDNDLGAAKTLFRIDGEVPAGAAPGAAANVRTTGIRAPSEVRPGAAVEAAVEVVNEGPAGLHRATIATSPLPVTGTLEGEACPSRVSTTAGVSGPGPSISQGEKESEAAAWCYLGEGEARRITVPLDPVSRPGNYRLVADNRETTVRVLSAPAAFAYGERMEIESPAAAGATTVVRVPVKNIGGQTGTTRVELRADDRVVAAEEVELSPGEERVVAISHRFAQAGPRRLRVGDFPEWPYATFANVEARFRQTRDRIIIEAGGGRHDIRHTDREYAAVYMPVDGDFAAEVRYLVHLVTGPYAGGGILAKNDMTRPADDAGCVLAWRYPKYDVPSFADPQDIRLAREGDAFEGGPLVSPDTAAPRLDVGIFANAFSGKDEAITVEFEGFHIRR